MALSRRGFLTAVLGASSAALVLSKLDLVAQALPDIGVAVEPIEGQAWQSTFEAIHLEAYGCFMRDLHVNGRPLKSLHEQSRVGELLPTGEVLAHQFNVSVAKEGLHVGAAMQALSDAVLDYGIDRYGVLQNPSGTAYCASLGPLRMVAMYEVMFDRLLLRFDVVGAASEPMFAQRRRIDELKVRIRRRIAFYQSGRIPAMW